MNQIVVVNLRNRSNWTAAPVVRIDRTTVLGNPYRIGTHGTREEVVLMYRKNLLKLYRTDPQIRYTIDLIRKFPKVQLACWCAPALCHGDAIIDFIKHLEQHPYT